MKMNKRGVTLIELVVVFAIIALGAVLMIPNMGAWMPNYRLRNATRDLISTMRVAQMRAVSSNAEYRVEILVGGSYRLQRFSSGLADPWITEGEATTFPTGITIQSNNFLNTNPLFRPNSSSNGGTIVLVNTKQTTRTIRVLPSTGRISIE